MSTPFKECPSCGAHLDAGERCDCKETAAADRAQANTARITPPARAYYVGVDLADGKHSYRDGPRPRGKRVKEKAPDA